MTIKRYAIIVAGGKGVRVGGDIPKQFRLLCGKPLLMHTVEAFFNASKDISIIVVLPDHHKDYWHNLCRDYGFNTPHTIISGGDNRWHSVKNGLEAIERDSVVAIHDGVRPMVSAKLINEGFSAAEVYGCVVPAIEPTDSLRLVIECKGSRAVNRSDYRAVQTPQVFRGGVIIDAYRKPYDEKFTDDASVAEAASEKIHLIEGERCNIKITTPEDLIFAEILIKGA